MVFTSVNLNFGCPSGTVVSKRKGAGFLADPKELEMLLEEVLENSPLAVSVKTRVGIKDPDEWEALCGVYAKFPLEELIIHPRLQNDYYSGTPRMETFARALEQIHVPLCYNGDICSVEDYKKVTAAGDYWKIPDWSEKSKETHRQIKPGCGRSMMKF